MRLEHPPRHRDRAPTGPRTNGLLPKIMEEIRETFTDARSSRTFPDGSRSTTRSCRRICCFENIGGDIDKVRHTGDCLRPFPGFGRKATAARALVGSSDPPGAFRIETAKVLELKITRLAEACGTTHRNIFDMRSPGYKGWMRGRLFCLAGLDLFSAPRGAEWMPNAGKKVYVRPRRRMSPSIFAWRRARACKARQLASDQPVRPAQSLTPATVVATMLVVMAAQRLPLRRSHIDPSGFLPCR